MDGDTSAFIFHEIVQYDPETTQGKGIVIACYMPAIFGISDIGDIDEVAFVDGTRENSINPFVAAACPLLLTSSAICMTAGFGNIK